MPSPTGLRTGARLDGERRLVHVSDVARAVEDQFASAFSRRIWVIGVVGPLRDDPAGERFRLADARATQAGGNTADSAADMADAADTADGRAYGDGADGDDDGWVATLPCLLTPEHREAIEDTLIRLHDVSVDDVLVPGYLLRVGGLLSYDQRRHSTVFTVSAVDLTTSRSWLGERRELARGAAHERGLAGRQQALVLQVAPTRVAVVGPAGDAGVAEAVDALSAGGYAVDVRVHQPVARGEQASPALSAALADAARGGADVVLLVRGAGRPLGLAPFDEDPLVQAVAASPVPVLTGIGGPDDMTVADEVAFSHHATPTAAAQAVLVRLRRSEQLLEAGLTGTRRAARRALERAEGDLRVAERSVTAAVEQARLRAQRAARRRRLAVWAVAAVLAVSVAVLVVLTRRPAWLALLAVPLALVVGERFWNRLRPHQRRRSVDVQDPTFAHALERLDRIRQELDLTSNPDEVERLHDESVHLGERCRTILRDSPARGVGAARPPAPSAPAGSAAPAAQTQPVPPLRGTDSAATAPTAVTRPVPSLRTAETMQTQPVPTGGRPAPPAGPGAPAEETVGLRRMRAPSEPASESDRDRRAGGEADRERRPDDDGTQPTVLLPLDRQGVPSQPREP